MYLDTSKDITSDKSFRDGMQLDRQFSSSSSSPCVNRDVPCPALGMALVYAVSTIVMTCLSGPGRAKPPRLNLKQVWALVACRGNQVQRSQESLTLAQVHGQNAPKGATKLRITPPC